MKYPKGLRLGDLVIVTYDDLAGVAVGSSDDADLVRDIEYCGYFVRFKGKGGKRLLICANVRNDKDYDGWSSWPTSVVTRIERLENRNERDRETEADCRPGLPPGVPPPGVADGIS